MNWSVMDFNCSLMLFDDDLMFVCLLGNKKCLM